jgi:hypothetical protein
LNRKRHSFFVTCCDLEIEFSEVILTCFISIRWLWTHQKIGMDKFRHTIMSFDWDCNKADSVLRTFVKESNVRWRFWLSILVSIYRRRYVRTARRYSDVMEIHEMWLNGIRNPGNRLRNGYKLHFYNPPWNIIKQDVDIDSQHDQKFRIDLNKLINGWSKIKCLLNGFVETSAL